MEFDILNELIDMPKKAEASKAKKKLYIEQIGILLAEEGFSENAIKYLKSGFTFAGAKPVAIYFQKLPLDQRIAEISKMLASELFRGGEKIVAFRFGISLSAYSIEWFGVDQQLLIEMIKILPLASKNKEKKLLKDAPKIFEKYFLDVVSDATELPCIDLTVLKDIHVREFGQMMFQILNGVSSKYRGRAKRIAEWIGSGITTTVTDAGLAVEKSQKEAVETGEVAKGDLSTANFTPVVENTTEEEIHATTDVSVKKAVVLTEKELLDALVMFGDFSSRLEATVAAWALTKKELDTARNQTVDLQRKLQQYEIKLDSEKKRNEQMTRELVYRSKIIEDLQNQLIETKERIVGHEKKIEEVTSENVRLNSIISVYSSDKQNSQSEQLNAIASKLKSEYRDFKDVECEEMTIDLGENFRFQLQSVFRILAKVGIDVERR